MDKIKISRRTFPEIKEIYDIQSGNIIDTVIISQEIRFVAVLEQNEINIDNKIKITFNSGVDIIQYVESLISQFDDTRYDSANRVESFSVIEYDQSKMDTIILSATGEVLKRVYISNNITPISYSDQLKLSDIGGVVTIKFKKFVQHNVLNYIIRNVQSQNDIPPIVDIADVIDGGIF